MQLVDINSIHPSTYNPRDADPQRLKYIEYSLRKLGFLLPIYVCSGTNEIISGHQRHHVSKLIGLKKVPVEFVEPMNLQERKAYNICFNRGTNDLGRNESSHSITEKLKHYDLESMVNELSDVEDYYPCLRSVEVDGKELAKVNIKQEDKYCNNMARTLSVKTGYMPVIITKDLKVVNGIGRLFNQLEKGVNKIKCIVIDDDRAKLAYAMLNLVSMDFNLQKKYADDLRYNSFRRARTTRKGGLGRGMIVGAFGNSSKSKDYSTLKGEAKKVWVSKYGTEIVDFGAGRLTDTKILIDVGINVYPFEPFYCDNGSDQINREKSKQIARNFLSAVASGREFSTIFISSVMNSVPFLEDRLNILAICSALCTRTTLLSLWIMSTGYAIYRQIDNEYLSNNYANLNQFKLDYEDGILLGEFSKKPKVQKYHTRDEIVELTKNFFSDVNILKFDNDFLVECRDAKVNVERLKKAIEFEFDLPYPDGQRMGLVNEAKAAFSKRLGVNL